MKSVRIAALALLAVIAVGLFGWATIAGAKQGEIMGIIARKGDAAIVAQDQTVTGGKVVVAEVVAPEASWVIVHQDAGGGKPGMRLGSVHVDRGTHTDLVVPLESTDLTPRVLIAVHADRGEPGKREVNMKDMAHSPDRPFFVDGKEVATAIAVR